MVSCDGVYDISKIALASVFETLWYDKESDVKDFRQLEVRHVVGSRPDYFPKWI